jgi:putative DNA primase/helicase
MKAEPIAASATAASMPDAHAGNGVASGHSNGTPIDHVNGSETPVDKPPAKQSKTGSSVLAARPPKPALAHIKWTDISDELKALPQWVVWRYIWRNNGSNPGKWTKIPFRCNIPPKSIPEPASSTDPETWGTFEQAWNSIQGYSGIGFVFAPDGPHGGVDLDHCITGGEIAPWALEILEQLGPTYAEISPSGEGIKIFGRFRLEGTGTKKDDFAGPGTAVEIYDRGRYFTVTGQRYGDTTTLNDINNGATGLYTRIKPAKPERPDNPKPISQTGEMSTANGSGGLSDEQIFEKLQKAKNASKFSALFHAGDLSDYGGNHSRADFALINMLGWYAGPSGVDQVERMFSRSALGQRPKWTDRPDYRVNSIVNALSTMTKFWEPPTPRVKSNRKAQPERNYNTPPIDPDADVIDDLVKVCVTDLPLTDLGNGERLAKWFGNDLRYVHDWKKWVVWDKRRWKVDNTAKAARYAALAIRRIYREAGSEEDKDKRKQIKAWAWMSESKARRDAMMNMASSTMPIPIEHTKLDTDPWSLNCRNGTIDLRTGKLREHSRADLITKMVPANYDPDAECPLWIETLRTFLVSDEMIEYWQRLCGMAMTGVIEDHILPICHGEGSNGKSTLLGALLDTMGGDYAMKAAPDLLVAKSNETHPTDKTDLFGKRIVVAIETGEGVRLNESLIKELTGGDRIRARRMREDMWEFEPTHTVFLATNHEPQVKGTDHGIWRRIKKVPFSVKMSDAAAKKDVPRKLKNEAAGILAWMVRGCLAWQADGLKTPKVVTEATEAYRKDQDVIETFLSEHCVGSPSSPDFKVKAGVLYARYKAWAEESGMRYDSLTKFGHAIQKKGYEKSISNGNWYLGIGLRTSPGSAKASENTTSSEDLEDLEGKSPLNGPSACNGKSTGGSAPSAPSPPKGGKLAFQTSDKTKIREAVANWPDTHREMWGRRTAELEEGGFEWWRAEDCAYREIVHELSTNDSH